jgi:hypothetical protein
VRTFPDAAAESLIFARVIRGDPLKDSRSPKGPAQRLLMLPASSSPTKLDHSHSLQPHLEAKWLPGGMSLRLCEGRGEAWVGERIQISKPFFSAFRLARSRSPKPLGFGAGEVQRKCVCANEKVLDAHQAAEPGTGAKTRLRKRLVLEPARTRAAPRRWLRAKRKLLFV